MNTPLQHIGKRVDDFVYSGAIRLLGGGARAYAALAERYLTRGWTEEAVETYRKAIELKPTQPIYHYRTAQLLVLLERFSEATNSCEQALKFNKDLAEAYVLLGTLHKRNGDPTIALTNFRKAMEYSLKDVSAYSTIAKAFAEAELFEEAAHAYREIIRISPRNVTAYGVMAETYSKLKRYPEALEAYRHAVELKPTADGFGILASAYARSGKYREAVEAYQKAMKLEPGFAQGWNRLSEIYIKLEDFEKRAHGGQMDEPTKILFAKLRQEQEALENFKEAIRQKPDDPEAYLQMGKLYLELHLPAKAIDFLRHVHRMNIKGIGTPRLLGLAYMEMGKHTEARRFIEQALSEQKNDYQIWSALGEICARQGKHDESVIAFQEALRLKPQDAVLHRQMGDLLRRLGRHAEASRFYWQAIRLNPQDGLARYGLGVTYVRLDQRAYAIEQKSVLKTIDPKLAAELDHVIWRLSKNPKS